MSDLPTDEDVDELADLFEQVDEVLGFWRRVLSLETAASIHALAWGELATSTARRERFRRALQGDSVTAMPPDEDDEALEARMVKRARALVAEALAPYQGAMSEAELEAMRAIMESELLVNPEERKRLRQSLDDPALDGSDQVGGAPKPEAPGKEGESE